jgi:dATP pyrophosphohydrolase
LRELQEETGLTNEGTMISTGVYRTFTIDQRWKYKYDNNTKENIEYEFYYELKQPHKIKLNSKEHSNFEWVDIEDAIKMVWSWTNKESLKKLAMNS